MEKSRCNIKEALKTMLDKAAGEYGSESKPVSLLMDEEVYVCHSCM